MIGGGDRRSSWGGEEANQFSGMMGDQWPQAITATAPYIHAFFPEVYRSCECASVVSMYCAWRVC